MGARKRCGVATAIAATCLAALPASSWGAVPEQAIYDALTGVHHNYGQSYNIGIVELGDHIRFQSNGRVLTTVEIEVQHCYTHECLFKRYGDSTSPRVDFPYQVELTLNLYRPLHPDDVIASRTRTVTIRGPLDDYAYVPVTFDFSGVVVPRSLYYGIVLPTSSVDGVLTDQENLWVILWAQSAQSANDGRVPVGRDVEPGWAYMRSDYDAPFLASDHPGIGGFSTPAIRFNALSTDACKGGGWKEMSRGNGSHFKNQGDCVEYVNTGE